MSSLLYNGYRVFPGGKERPGRDADPSPPSSAVGHKRLELYLYSLCGPYSLYRASVPVQGYTLPHFTSLYLTLPYFTEQYMSVLIEEILEEDGKGNTNTIIMGDWNSVVGGEPYRNIVGPHGLGGKNHRGQMLINFYERNGLIVTNTWFRKPKRRLYTFKAPGDRSRHQLDYILVKH